MNPTICWPDKTLPLEIYCAPGVLTGLEVLASDALLAMPRTGLGVGGLLLGKRRGGCIDILKSTEIDCSHALGPAFVLTPDEITASLPVRGAEDDADQGADYDVVGWYCTKPSYSKINGQMVLTGPDRALFDALCPEQWQVALLIRPSLGNATIGAFGFRETGDSGDSFAVGTPQELAWQDLAAYQYSSPEPGVVKLATGQPKNGGPPEVVAPPADEVTPELPAFVATPVPVTLSPAGAPFSVSPPAVPRPPRHIVPTVLAAIAIMALLFLAAAIFSAITGFPIFRFR